MYNVLNKVTYNHSFSPGHKGKITYQTVRHYQVQVKQSPAILDKSKEACRSPVRPPITYWQPAQFI